MTIASVEITKNDPYVSQIVTTSKGEKLPIPRTMGNNTEIQALNNGKYVIIDKNVINENGKPDINLLTEEELIARYSNEVGQSIQFVA